MIKTSTANSVFSPEQQEWIWQFIASHMPPPLPQLSDANPTSGSTTTTTTSSTAPFGASSVGNLGELLVMFIHVAMHPSIVILKYKQGLLLALWLYICYVVHANSLAIARNIRITVAGLVFR